MKCMLREDLEKLLDESPIDSLTFTDGFTPTYYFCCMGQKGTQVQLGKYFLAKAYSPHDICSHIHQHLLPDEPRIA